MPKIQRQSSPPARPEHLGQAEVPPPPPEVSEVPPEAEETPAVLDTTLGNVKRRPNKAAYRYDTEVVRHSADDYPTPRGFLEPLLDHLHLPRSTPVLEPCAGGGHVVQVLRERFDSVYFEDLHYSGQDFLQSEPPERPTPGWIITNPPYKHAEAFVRHSLKHAENVAMLLNSAFVESVTRSNGLFKEHPPAEILMCNRRMRIEGGKSSVFAHIWVVWRYDEDDTRFRWLDITGDKQMPSGHLPEVWPDA